uniref:Uncharacterized protein n=1 Tax=Branchiostoma floridae TaxID=7739 RepID=C3ZZB7_BRAFL|eukprot:XP_002586110.1 hypothetical protein BRAFLDRAFT_110012 [Branchiostoma floridae]
MVNFLPPDFYEHFTLFDVPIQILLQQSITTDDKAEGLLLQFVCQFEGLYGQQVSSYFSRLATKRRKTPEDAEDNQQDDIESPNSRIQEEIITDAQLCHPVLYDTYYLCDLAKSAQYYHQFSTEARWHDKNSGPAAEAIIAGGETGSGICLHQDGPSKFFKKYQTFDVTLPQCQCQKCRVGMLPGLFSESCREMAEVLCEPGEDV